MRTEMPESHWMRNRLTTNQPLFKARSAPPPISFDCHFGCFGGTSEKISRSTNVISRFTRTGKMQETAFRRLP
jgi:hypothetical protein